MYRRSLVFAMVVVFSISSASHAVDTTRYALVAPMSPMKVPALLISPLPPKKIPVFPKLESSATGKGLYAQISKARAPETSKLEDENLINWTPMSIEALGYDIREVWRMQDKVWTCGGVGFNR